MNTLKIAAILVGGTFLAACGAEQQVAAPPDPFEVTEYATGHYCGMLVEDHDGPKGQIHLASNAGPIWFTSVRDTVAFTRLPEEAKDITAIYVNDMGRATNWASPEPGTWVDAREAWFVIESGRLGGMGVPEAVPFSDASAAENFRDAHGGMLVRFDEIPDDYVLGPVELNGHAGGQGEMSHGNH